MKKLTGILFICCIAAAFSFKKYEKEKINWITMQELNSLYAKEPKPILIDIYTDWCGWCKEMDRTTYKHEKLAKYINEHYYAVKYNAEAREDLSFNNKLFRYNPQYRTHDLAIYLTGGQLSYPTTVFLGTTADQPAPIPGYMKPKQMEAPLKFFGEKANLSQTFVAFNKGLRKEW